MNPTGNEIYKWCEDLFPICRSLTGNGVRQTLAYLKKILPQLEIFSVPSGTQAFDWEVPKEWNIADAWVKDSAGNKVIDFKDSNLHVVGYSTPVHQKMSLDELDKHLYSLPDQADAIPYITSYYKERWGFCLKHSTREKLKEDTYEVFIDSRLSDGEMNYGELIIKGRSKKEILISSYVCHPSMANNELSGPAVVAALAKWIGQKEREHTYRILFMPETIGAIYYISKNMEHLKKHIQSGFVVTCIGDNNGYSFVNTPTADTLADKIIEWAANTQSNGQYTKYSFLERGSDERQYCAPGVDLPVVSVCRSKYAEYPEYHTSLDNLDYISPKGLEGGFGYLQKAIWALEKNKIYKSTVLCEPKLGKRGLYPTLSTKETAAQTRTMMNLLAYANGQRSLIDIARICHADFIVLSEIAEKLVSAGVIEDVNAMNNTENYEGPHVACR